MIDYDDDGGDDNDRAGDDDDEDTYLIKYTHVQADVSSFILVALLESRIPYLQNHN